MNFKNEEFLKNYFKINKRIRIILIKKFELRTICKHEIIGLIYSKAIVLHLVKLHTILPF